MLMVQREEPRESRGGLLETKEVSGSPDRENVVEHIPEKEMRRHTSMRNTNSGRRRADPQPESDLTSITGDGMERQEVTHTHNTHRNTT